MEINGYIAVKTILNYIEYSIDNYSDYLEYLTDRICSLDLSRIVERYSCEDFEGAVFDFYINSRLLLPSGYAMIRITGDIDYDNPAIMDKLMRNENFLRFLDENITKFKENFNKITTHVLVPNNVNFIFYRKNIYAEASPSNQYDIKWESFKLLDNHIGVKDINFSIKL